MNVPAGYTALDLVGFTDKGIYSSSANYVQNDIVHYGGDMWRCLIDDTTNIAPSEGLNWTLWIGEPTNLTEAIIAPLEVSPATDAHSVGDQLIFNDVLYKVISAISIGDSLTVGTNIEAARKIVYQISGIESDIATIEPTATASKNYAVGEYMFFGWEFYRVTTAITAGDTIVTTGAGQNVTEVTVGDELTSLNSHLAKLDDVDSAIFNVYGSKNLCPNNVTTQVKNGVTFTVNNDGSVTVNGTATNNAIVLLHTGENILRQGNYILSGCPSGGATSTYRLDVIAYYSSDEITYEDTGNSCAFTILGTETDVAFRIRVQGGVTVNNLTFYPMIRDARITDDTYVPYAMTNKQITDSLAHVYNLSLINQNSISFTLPNTTDKYIGYIILMTYSSGVELNASIRPIIIISSSEMSVGKEIGNTFATVSSATVSNGTVTITFSSSIQAMGSVILQKR